jgi:DNA-binding CsgD family transcriptional regulator/predicted DNA-binding transcriptional regulator AlpA
VNLTENRTPRGVIYALIDTRDPVPLPPGTPEPPDPADIEIGYIGKVRNVRGWTTDYWLDIVLPRLRNHCSSQAYERAAYNACAAWIVDMLDSGYYPDITVVEWVFDGDVGAAEKRQIPAHVARGCVLTNDHHNPNGAMWRTTRPRTLSRSVDAPADEEDEADPEEGDRSASAAPEQRYFSTGQVAEILGVRQVTVQKLCARGAFPHAVRIGRPWMIPECDLTPELYARYAGEERPKGGRPPGLSKTGDAAQAARAVLAAPGAASLSARDREVLRLRAAGWTLDAIGAEIGLTRERVRQIEAQHRTRVFPATGGRPPRAPDSDVVEGVLDAPEDDGITGDDILTVSDVRRELGPISGELVRKLLRAGEFPHAFKRGADWFVPESDITPDLRARFAGGVRRGRRPTR